MIRAPNQDPDWQDKDPRDVRKVVKTECKLKGTGTGTALYEYILQLYCTGYIQLYSHRTAVSYHVRYDEVESVTPPL